MLFRSAKIIKERDHAHAQYKVFKMENARLNGELVMLSSSIPNAMMLVLLTLFLVKHLCQRRMLS